jgi:hypothetical protein
MKEGWTIRPWLATLSVIGLGALITVTVTTLRNEDLSASNPPAAHWTLPHITSDYSMPYAIPLVSPDGGHLAIRAISVRELDSRVFAKSLSGGQVWEIPFSRDVNGLAWSPAGKDLYFRSGETLYRASVAEKRVEQVCSGIGSVFLTTIGRDGVLLGHEQDADGGIVRLHPEDCSVEPILAVDPDREETFLRHPELLPDGRLLYFASLGSTGETRFTELGRGPGRPIVQTRTQSLWAHPDHLLYLKDGTLFALRVNPETLDPIGEPWPIALDVLEDVEGGLAHVSASATGVLAFVSASSRTRLVRKGSGSVVEELLADRRMSLGDLDSTGTRLLLASNGPEGRGDDLWILDLRTGKRDRLTSDPRPDWGGLWTPDGRSVVYARDVGLESELRVMSLEAPSDDRLLLRRRMIWPSDLTPDGSSVVFTQYNHALGTPELWRIPLRGGTAEPFLREIGAQTSALYSDDGQWISFFSSRNGPFALFVAPSDGSARPIAVPGETPLSYRWRRDTPSLLMSTVGIGRLTNWSSARAERSGDTVSVARTEPVFTSELPGDCLEARSGSFLCTETDLENSNLHHIVVNWRSLTSPVR